MTSLESYQRLQFIDGLIGYLDIRQWAFEKIRTTPAGSSLIDLRVHHSLYFTNLFGAVDLVRDYLPPDEARAFEDHLQQGFAMPSDYPYARELRNSIVHRGLDPAMHGTQRGAFVFAGCPPVVHSINGKKSYVCSVPLLVDLAAACNLATNRAVIAVLERKELLDPALHAPDEEETLAAVAATDMPDWAKVMATEAFATMDFEAMAAEIAQSRMKGLRSLLGGSA